MSSYGTVRDRVARPNWTELPSGNLSFFGGCVYTYLPSLFLALS